MTRPEGSNDMPKGFKRDEEQDVQMPSSSSKPASTSTPASKPAPATEEPADEPMEEDTDAISKKEADEFKAQGTAAYKARKFEEAVELYSKAWDTWPKDVTYLTNLSGGLNVL
jgi:stress-induced-phosphoprotein 1